MVKRNRPSASLVACTFGGALASAKSSRYNLAPEIGFPVGSRTRPDRAMVSASMFLAGFAAAFALELVVLAAGGSSSRRASAGSRAERATPTIPQLTARNMTAANFILVDSMGLIAP